MSSAAAPLATTPMLAPSSAFITSCHSVAPPRSKPLATAMSKNWLLDLLGDGDDVEPGLDQGDLVVRDVAGEGDVTADHRRAHLRAGGHLHRLDLEPVVGVEPLGLRHVLRQRGERRGEGDRDGLRLLQHVRGAAAVVGCRRRRAIAGGGRRAPRRRPPSWPAPRRSSPVVATAVVRRWPARRLPRRRHRRRRRRTRRARRRKRAPRPRPCGVGVNACEEPPG